MSDPRIPLKHPLAAGLLAFLVPGAGHCYQGRYFKAVVYFVCITGLFQSDIRMPARNSPVMHTKYTTALKYRP